MKLLKWMRKKSMKKQIDVQMNLSLPKRLDTNDFRKDLSEAMSDFALFYFKVDQMLKSKKINAEQKQLIMLTIGSMFNDTMDKVVAPHVEAEEKKGDSKDPPNYIG